VHQCRSRSRRAAFDWGLQVARGVEQRPSRPRRRCQTRGHHRPSRLGAEEPSARLPSHRWIDPQKHGAREAMAAVAGAVAASVQQQQAMEVESVVARASRSRCFVAMFGLVESICVAEHQRHAMQVVSLVPWMARGALAVGRTRGG